MKALPAACGWPPELAEIVARATPLWERSRSAAPAASASAQGLAARRLARWQRVAADGDPGTFAERLRLDGLSPEEAFRLLGPTAAPGAGGPLPTWAALFAECLEEARGPVHDCPPPGTGPEAELPLRLRGLLAPFLRVARRKLLAGSDPGRLSDAAHEQASRSLAGSLATLFAEATEFDSALRSRSADVNLGPASRPQPRHADREAPGADFLRFFTRFPVLARLAATVVACWVETTAEFLRRLTADWPSIQAMFGEGTDARQVVAVWPALSDPHHGRRTVWAVQFDTGLRLVYKPRPAGLEAAFQTFLAWLNDRCPPLALRVLRLLPRAGYHWVEFVAHRPCDTAAEARAYFRRTGMLLAILGAFHGTDIHDENLVAHGEHPVLVDTELLLGHRARAASRDARADSVLGTGLLPSWQENERGEAYDLSGLGGGVFDQAPGSPWPANVAALGETPLPPGEYAEDIVAGFRAAYHFLVRHRDDLLAPDGPLHLFAGQPVRFVHNVSQVYAQLLKRARHPALLRDAVDRSIEFDVLARRLLGSDLPAAWPLLAEEIAALERLDIPYFAANSSDTALPLPSGGVVQGFFAGPAVERVRSRVASLAARDCKAQVALIRDALAAWVARDDPPPVGPAESPAPVWTGPPLTNEEKIEHALVLARELGRRAVRAAEGGPTWAGLERLSVSGRYRLRPADGGLYGGRAGIAVFLAATGRVAGDDALLDLARAIPRALVANRDGLACLGLGGATGLGSVVYAFTCLGRLLEDEEVLAGAAHIGARITPALVAADRSLDVVAGAAGAVLGLLALYRATGGPDALSAAVACGEHLVRTCLPGGEGSPWKGPGDRCPWTGFSHGASGIAYALARLHAATGRPDFRAVARQALAYENAAFSQEEGNWPDFRSEAPGRFQTAWCHGAPGIALARLGILGVLDEPAARPGLAEGLATTRAFPPVGVDHLCCGHLGRAEILLEASRQLGRPEFREAAEVVAAHVVRSAERLGGFRLFAGLPRTAFHPGLFQGVAGVGYELLRLAEPARLPSLLLWE